MYNGYSKFIFFGLQIFESYVKPTLTVSSMHKKKLPSCKIDYSIRNIWQPNKIESIQEHSATKRPTLDKSTTCPTSTAFWSAVFSLLMFDWRNFGGNFSSFEAPNSSYLLTRMPDLRGRLNNLNLKCFVETYKVI